MATDTQDTPQATPLASAAQSVYSWSRAALSYLSGGAVPLPRVIVKAAANSIVANSQFLIQDASLKLQQGVIDLNEWTATMRTAIKQQEIAAEALARGGWNQLRPADYVRISQRVEVQYSYLRGFQERIVSDRYGPTLEANGMLRHAKQYAGVARASYENVYMQVGKEAGRTRGKRIKGNVDSCPTCIAEDGVERDIDDVVPIGASECGPGKCQCIIVTW